MPRRTRRNLRDLALQRIFRLFELAEAFFHLDRKLSDRYVELALRIAKKARVRIPKELKYRYCKKCKKFLKPGVNARIRIRGGRMPHIVISCLNCGFHRRIPIRPKRR